MVNIEIKKVGKVKGEILWMSDKFVKITFKTYKGIWPFLIKKEHTEIFHISEIFNFNELYQDSNTVIKIV